MSKNHKNDQGGSTFTYNGYGRHIEISVDEDVSLDTMMDEIKSFLLAIGYDPETVNSYLDPDYASINDLTEATDKWRELEAQDDIKWGWCDIDEYPTGLNVKDNAIVTKDDEELPKDYCSGGS